MVVFFVLTFGAILVCLLGLFLLRPLATTTKEKWQFKAMAALEGLQEAVTKGGLTALDLKEIIGQVAGKGHDRLVNTLAIASLGAKLAKEEREGHG